MADSRTKKRQILGAAAELFVDLGFDGTTLPMVAKNSDAAVGSIQHFFHDKARLAAAVYDHVAADLIADCEAALNGQGRGVERAIRALVVACLAWQGKHPGHRRLLGLLEANISIAALSEVDDLRHRLERVFAAWAQPLVKTGVIAPIAGAELYTVLMAPAMSVELKPGSHDPDVADWIDRLTKLAVFAIAPEGGKLIRPDARRSTRGRSTVSEPPVPGSEQKNLFGL